MKKPWVLRLYCVLAGLLLCASPARGQFQPRLLEEPAIDARWIVEGFAGFWNPGSEMFISSESLGIPGTDIDFKNDLGLTDRRFGNLRLTLRPAMKHKFRFERIPITYEEGPVTVARDIIFNGQRYAVGVPVNWEVEWKAYRFAYEYDFLVRNRGFVGVVVEAKYTNVKATLATPFFDEFAHARAPVPALGGIGRYNIAPNISITGEVTGFRLPHGISEDYRAHYADVDIYGTINLNRYVGAQFGWRRLDVGYVAEEDTGDFDLKGLYFGVVARY
jgi:hypothetical protein